MKTNRLERVARKSLFAFVILLTAATAAPAGETYWQHDPATPGDWHDPTNWDNGLPVPDWYSYAYIDNGGTAAVTSTDLGAGRLYVGHIASGHVVQTSGDIWANVHMYLGYEAGASGTYMLKDGTLTSGWSTYIQQDNEHIGYSGTGLFCQTNGEHEVAYNTYLATNSGSTGRYEISGGSLRVRQHFFVGRRGIGSFSHDGGTVNVGSMLWLGSSDGGVGTYELDSGELGTKDLKVYANSNFIQNSGTNTVGYYLTVYENGIYELRNGTLNQGVYYCGGDQKIRGTFIQEGDSIHNAANDLKVENMGRFYLRSGVLSVGGWETIRGSGIFEQSGGEHDALSIHVDGDGGQYNLTGGDLTSQRTEVGNRGRGTFIHSGGSHITDVFEMLPYLANSRGEYRLSGTGAFIAQDAIFGGPLNDLFEQTGGSANFTNSLTIGGKWFGHDDAWGTYRITTGTLQARNLYVGEAGNGVFRVVGASAMIQTATYEQGSRGTLISEITGDGISLIEVGGPATLGGTWDVEKNGAVYGRFDILTAGEGISGIFDSVALPSLNWTWGIENSHTLWAEYAPLEIAIDIKPGSDPNSINLGANGVVSLAILGADAFDVHDVDQFSLELEGGTPKQKGKSGIIIDFEDINDDSFLDLIVHFPISELELAPDATEAVLTGYLLDGTEILGTDTVNLVGGPMFRGEVHANPEPATLSLLVIGGLALIRRRKS